MSTDSNSGSGLDEEALSKWRIIRPHIMNGVQIAAISRIERIPVRTLWRWVEMYKAGGFRGLQRKTRVDRGNRKIPTELEKLIEGYCLQKPALSVAAIHRQLAGICSQQRWAHPGYSVVYDVSRNIDPALLTLAQQGAKIYKEEFDLVYRRESTRSNQIWQADHSQLDCYVLDERGKSRKPWSAIDSFSCYFSIAFCFEAISDNWRKPLLIDCCALSRCCISWTRPKADVTICAKLTKIL